jgi:predicted transcriptional regulator of viral defense system
MSRKGFLEIVNSQGGYVSVRNALNYGVSESTIRRYAANGRLEHVARGVYKLPYVYDDRFYEYSLRYSNGIYSLETALYLHGLSDREPDTLNMAFPANYNTSKLSGDIVSNRESAKFYGVGKTKIVSPQGNDIVIYDVERTLCDIVRPRNNVDIALISAAFKTYSQSSDRKVRQLSKYAILLGVRDVVGRYLEVLL